MEAHHLKLWRRAKLMLDSRPTYETAAELQRAERLVKEWRQQNMKLVGETACSKHSRSNSETPGNLYPN